MIIRRFRNPDLLMSHFFEGVKFIWKRIFEPKPHVRSHFDQIDHSENTHFRVVHFLTNFGTKEAIKMTKHQKTKSVRKILYCI